MGKFIGDPFFLGQAWISYGRKPKVEVRMGTHWKEDVIRE